jgi:hypothetical protein
MCLNIYIHQKISSDNTVSQPVKNVRTFYENVIFINMFRTHHLPYNQTVKTSSHNHNLFNNTLNATILTLWRVNFWVVLRRMVFNNRRFGTLCLFHLHRRVDANFASIRLWRWNAGEQPKWLHTTYRTTQMVTHDIQNPNGYTRHTEHGEGLK